MDKSNVIGVQDARSVFRLLHEICELGFDPVLWRRHLLEGINRLVDAQVAIGIELKVEPKKEPVLTNFFDLGWGTERERGVFLDTLNRVQKEGDYLENPFYRGVNATDQCHVMTGHETLGVDYYHRHQFFNDCIRAVGCDDTLFVCSAVVCGSKLVLSMHRPSNSRAFNRKEMSLVRMLMEDVGPCLHSRLRTAPTASLCDLSERKRQVLRHLLCGLSEKQIAAELAISRNTVHEYIASVYRHYEVNDRAELLSRFISNSVRETLQFPSD